MRIGPRILLGTFVLVALAAILLAQVFVQQVKPGVRQTMEDTLVDTANLLAELARDDLLDGRIEDGRFARSVRALAARDIGADIWGFEKRRAQYRIYVTDARGIVVFDSTGEAVGEDYSRWNDVHLTLRGAYGARSTRSDPDDEDSSVMHVAAPIRDRAGRIAGVLTVAKPNRTIAPFIERSQAVVARWGGVLVAVALLLGVATAWWLSRELGKLRRYADAVTAGGRAELPRTAGEFHELGQALETMRTRLEGKQYVERYVHALTHELKSPLTAISASADLLAATGGAPMPDADRARFVEAIRHQSGRMATMIDKLLALAAVEHRRALDAPAEVEIPPLLDDVARDVSMHAEERGVAVRCSAGAACGVVRGDRFLLRQAIGNLVENAIDFSPARGGVEVRARREGDTVSVEVLDRGPGVPDYARGQVFDRFYSLPRPDGGSRSSGLGLSFVAEVAALHGGYARLDPREGGGTVARLVVPAG
ncbi:two-component system sensor histidine kinase CreC [Luteimonas pelagia]